LLIPYKFDASFIQFLYFNGYNLKKNMNMKIKQKIIAIIAKYFEWFFTFIYVLYPNV